MSETKYIIPKGTHDILPIDSYKWQYVEKIARKVASLFGCLEIRTPTFEHTELFYRSIGDCTDVVSKEMYTFFDKSSPPASFTLKPEGTASVARSFVENNLDTMGLPLKMYYITSLYRYEKPQKGRYRQHNQFGVEFYGSYSPFMEFEVIALAYIFLKQIGINDILLNINSIGCATCRQNYIISLKNFIVSNLQGFCSTCNTRFEKNTLRVLDCKNKDCINLLKDAPNIANYLCQECQQHNDKLLCLLDDNEIPYVINSKLVRGLDYYNRTVFELITKSSNLGNQSTICGGGRYDNLIKSIGGKDIGCVGFGMGLERVIFLLEQQNSTFDKKQLDIFVMYASQAQAEVAFDISNKLRKNGISAVVDYNNKSLKSQFKHADRIMTKYALVIGEEEVNTGNAVLKHMTTKQERIVNIYQLDSLVL